MAKKKGNHTKQTLRFYWAEMRARLWMFVLLCVLIIGANVIGIIIPTYYKRFFDALPALQNGGSITILVSILVTIAIFELIRWVVWRGAMFINNPFQTVIIASLANKSFAHLHKHSFSYFNNNFVGSLVKRVNWFTRAFEGIIDKLVWDFIPLFVNVTMILAIFATKNLWLAGAVFVWMVLFLASNWIFTSYKIKFDLERNEAESSATAVLADTITNHSNVKLFVGYDREVANFAKSNDLVRRLKNFTWNLDNVFDAMQSLLIIVLQIGVFYIAIRLWQNHALTVGDFVLLQTYTIILFQTVWGFGRIVRHMYSELADADEMTEILLTPHEIKDAADAKELQVDKGSIVFDDVSFNYNETRSIIKNMSFTIAPHEKVALVGPSGAGKSTIVKLILRMHEVTGGKIKIDGQPITSVTQESLWGAISLVPQDPILFHRTLMENIRYGKPDASDEEVVAAAKLAHCDEFIEEFPEKYQTYVGERGVKLSGGERQRVAIARAILRNAPILVLDEATSSLDSESEHLIQDALNNLMKNKTVIVVAHRLSTIMKMDRILVINHGAIIEEGKHDELLKNPHGMYNKLWTRQAGGFMQDDNSEEEADNAKKSELQASANESD